MCSARGRRRARATRARRDPQIEVLLRAGRRRPGRGARRARRGTRRRPRRRPRSSTARSTARARPGCRPGAAPRSTMRAITLLGDAGDGAAPAGVAPRRTRAPPDRRTAIGHAVGGERAEHRARAIADQAVELGRLGQRLADRPDVGAVDVLGDLQLRRGRSRRARRARRAVLLDHRLIVAPALAEVERARGPIETPPLRSGKPWTKPLVGNRPTSDGCGCRPRRTVVQTARSHQALLWCAPDEHDPFRQPRRRRHRRRRRPRPDATRSSSAARGAKVVVNDLGGGTDGSGGSSSAADAVVAEIVAAGGTGGRQLRLGGHARGRRRHRPAARSTRSAASTS